MRKLLLLLILLPFVAQASELYYGLGLRNSKYASVSIEQKNGWGLTIENSVFAQDLNFQYVRFAPSYNFTMPFSIEGRYSLYAGTRYDREFFDLGGRLDLKWNAIGRLLQVEGSLLAYYDSDLGQNNAYSIGLQSILFHDVGLIAGIRNLPEYRKAEQRVYFGLALDLPRILVIPEISTPTDGHYQTTRFSVSFIYKNLLYKFKP